MFYYSFLNNAFPKARFIHIIRDGRDVALSYSKKPWLSDRSKKTSEREPGGYKYGPYARHWVEENRIKEFESTSDIHRCIWAWRRFVEATLKTTIDFSDDKLLTVRYENLVVSTESESNRILSFLRNKDLKKEKDYITKISQIHSNSKGNWKEELTKEDLDIIEKEAGLLLKKLNYL